MSPIPAITQPMSNGLSSNLNGTDVLKSLPTVNNIQQSKLVDIHAKFLKLSLKPQSSNRSLQDYSQSRQVPPPQTTKIEHPIVTFFKKILTPRKKTTTLNEKSIVSHSNHQGEIKATPSHP